MPIFKMKLVKDIEQMIDGKSKYNISRKDRKHERGGGVMILIKQSLKLNEVRYGMKTTEVIDVQLLMKNGEKCDKVTTYVPLKR